MGRGSSVVGRWALSFLRNLKTEGELLSPAQQGPPAPLEVLAAPRRHNAATTPKLAGRQTSHRQNRRPTRC